MSRPKLPPHLALERTRSFRSLVSLPSYPRSHRRPLGDQVIHVGQLSRCVSTLPHLSIFRLSPFELQLIVLVHPPSRRLLRVRLLLFFFPSFHFSQPVAPPPPFLRLAPFSVFTSGFPTAARSPAPPSSATEARSWIPPSSRRRRRETSTEAT